MSGKRRVTSDNEEESSTQAQVSASKRPRTVGFDSDPEIRYIPNSPKVDKGKAKQTSHKANDDEGDGAVNGVGVDEVEEQKFEEENSEAVWAAIHARRSIQGGIAEFGIIESIEMRQFMCHKALTFKFGEQINFIIGRNGSGKSAVLTAITIALGGKAISTGRGSGLKSFIREGQSMAEVTIQIKNQGDEAFKPKEYGKSIFITRRFTKDGSSAWKIKSSDNKTVVSTKKEELSAICDHMNIQVDNPMNVLTQDAARQFLSSSAPTEKYKFFLRGTQLSQLSDEYDACLQNISQTTQALTQKKEVIPELKNAFKEASARFEEASKAREQKKRAEELKKELAWAHVAAKETEMAKKIEEVEKAKRRLPKIEQSLAAAKTELGDATEEINSLEATHHQLGDITHLTTKKTDLQAEIRANKTKLTAFADDIKKMNTSIQTTKKSIDMYQKRIDEEAAKIADQTHGKREEINQKLRQAKLDVQECDGFLKDILDKKRQKMNDADNFTAESKKVEPAIGDIKRKILGLEETIQRWSKSQSDQYVAYGRDMQAMLQEIKNTRWKGEVIGPLGMYVKVKEPEKWAPLLRSTLGTHMSSFGVTHPHDREQLRALLQRYNNTHISIIIGQKDLFDYSRGEPPHDVLTVLRALEISDPWVLRILINAATIERTLLAPTRREGQVALSRINGGVAWTADMFRVNVFSEGGGSSSLLPHLPPRDPRQQLFPHRDAAAEVDHWKAEHAAAERELLAAKQAYENFHQECVSSRRAIDSLAQEERQVHDRIRQAKAVRDALQEEVNNDLPVAIASLEAAKLEAENEKESILAQFQAVTEQKREVDDAQKPLLTRLNELKAQIDDFEGQRTGIANKIEDAAQKRVQAQSHINHYKDKLTEEQRKLDDIQKVADDLQLEYEDWTTQAEQFCERWPNPRSVDVVTRNYQSVQNALEERERRHGASVEQMTIEVNKTKARLDQAQADLTNMTQLNKALKNSLIIRLARWQEFRRHIALRCKLVFQYHLSRRGYFGKVLFDHDAGTLQLKVQTDDQTGTQSTQSREKDPRSLSGGEKSFSTICLLLALWESIGCPLRCLDEFDVFMDAVNRKVSMKLLIDTANASDKKQYILITPLDMSNVHLGLTVRVNRMPDPERGQGVLQLK